MEAIIVILEISPRLQYLKSHENDYFSISFLYDNDIRTIDNLEQYINNQENLNITISNYSKKNELHFYFIKNGSIIIGTGKIPLINSIKWYNLNMMNIGDNLLNSKTKKNIDIINSPSNNNGLLKEIINTYNIKIKLSVEIKNHNCENANIINALQKSISTKGNADSNTNSISNTCTNSKTPKNIKNPTISLLTNNNNIKNQNQNYKKIELHNKKRFGNTTLFSVINKKLIRNKTEKKLIYHHNHHNDKREKMFSFNDYYDMNYNNNTEVSGSSLNITHKKNNMNLTNLKKDNNNIDNKRKQILKSIDRINMNKNNSSKMLDCVLPKNDCKRNKSNKKIKIKTKNLFMKQNDAKQRSIDEKNINSNSLRKIEEVIIDQNFKNKIKNDELIGITSSNTSNISSIYSSKNNFFFNTNIEENNLLEDNNTLLDMNNNYDDILLIDFNNKKKELFNKNYLEYISSVRDNIISLELRSFIHKIIQFSNDYQILYKKLFFNFNNYKYLYKYFKILLLYNIKKKNKLDYIKTSLLFKENKNVLISTGLKNYNNTRNNEILNNDIPLWNNLLCNCTDNSNNYLNEVNYSKKKLEFIHIFLKVCHGKEKYFNSLSKRCYNDIKKKYSAESNDELIKSNEKNSNSPSKMLILSNDNTSTFHIQKSLTKNNGNFTEQSVNIPKSKYLGKKSSNSRKEGLFSEKNKVSSFYHKNISKNKKTFENTRYHKK
jgi:hypothetical protein